MIEFDMEKRNKCFSAASIKVLGIGGAGCNTVNSIIESGYQGIEFIVANTDAQALELSKAQTKIQIGIKSTKGLGTGANPEVGKRAAEEDIDKIMETLNGADIVFLTGGMGGGTGSGGLPVIARALKDKGILSIVIVTRPFLFEGKRRARVADEVIQQLKKEVDTLIVIPNQKLFDVVDANVSMIDAFGMINDVLGQSVRGISDIIAKAGHINVDFADVRAIMKDRGFAVMGTGKARGENRAKKAALEATSSPLLENMSVKGAHGVLLNITGGKNLGLHEISQAVSVIYEQAHEDANIIFGAVIDEDLDDEVMVTIFATGFDHALESQHEALQQSKVAPIQATMIDRDATAMVKEAMPSEEPVIVAIQAAAPAALSIPVKEEALALERAIEKMPVDMKDLDVPAFMRHEARQEQESE